MKFMLIALNVLLAAAVAHLAWTYSSEPLTFASTSKKFSPAKLERKRAAATVKRVEKNPLDSPEVTEQKITAVLDRNIFKTERVPEAPANKNAQRNNQQIRADMSLVGTYVIGDSLGAIILQRLQGNSQQQLKALQQKEYEQYALSSNRVTDPKKKAAAAAEADEDAEEKKEAKEGEADSKQIVIVGGSPSISANNVFRQHLKVGDTTVNGYKLEEVTRTSAVLTKNSERIELTLLTPSEANNVARPQRNNNNNNQNRNNNQNNNNNNNNRNQQNNNNNNRNNNNNNNRNQQNNNNRNNNNNNRNNNNNNWNRDW